MYARPASMPATYAPLSAVTPTSAASGCVAILALLAAAITVLPRSTLPPAYSAAYLATELCGNHTLNVVHSMATYMVNAPVRCVASLYGDTRGAFIGLSGSSTRPDLTIHQPMAP